jgi:V8-like Glu-specific endopeptidase
VILMRSSVAVGLGLIPCLLLTVAEAAAQANPLEQMNVAVALESGPVINTADQRGVIFEGVVEVPDALWLRLTFDRAELGVDPMTGRGATLRMTSLADGASQTHTTSTLQQWRYTSAYFNGDAVKLEITADPGAAPSRITLTHVLAGPPAGGTIASQCGPTDDRLPSNDPRAARVVPVGCTVWLINDSQNCFLTAGHCTGSSLDIVEFNVPMSDSGGNIVHPGPEDQYAVDFSSVQSINGGVGNDWGYFGCFANTETGLTAGEAQGEWYTLAASPPPVSGQLIRITGYGVDSSPPERNQVQQTHAGPYVTFSGTTVQYQTDTEGGNSGSAVLDDSTGLAIGIHTHGGCNSSGGQNSGTGINHSGIQGALAAPQGVCIPTPPLAFTFPEGLPELIDPHGDTIRVEVSGQNNGTPEPNTGVLYLAVAGGPYLPMAMVEVSPHVYDAVFPAIECGVVAAYYFSAETTEAEVVTNPLFAPTDYYSTISAVSQQTVFVDNFEADQAWVVTNLPGLTSGTWERGTPVGGGDRGDPPTDADGSGQCYLTSNVDGDSDVDNGTTMLMSPAMDASQGIPVISYWRWFSNTAGSSPLQDIFVVEVSDDRGTTWAELETVGPDGPEVDGGWFRKEFLVSDFVDLTNEFVIRFIASDTDPQSVVEAAVDGVQLAQLNCGGVLGDLDGDGIVGITDFLILLAEWGPCPDPCPPACLGDLDESCSVDVNDFLILLANWTP